MSEVDPVLTRMKFAEKLIRQVGKTARRFFDSRDDLVIETKAAAQDLVSRADREVEDEIRAAITASFPDDGLLGEERGRGTGNSGFHWVIDPIDGTSPFLVGQPNWCISIALCQEDGPVAGVIFAPVLDELYTGRRGHGSFLNGRRLKIDPANSVQSGNIAFGATHRANPDGCGAFVSRLYHQGGVIFRIGSGALMLGYVAANRLAGYFDPHIYAWDCYAGNVIVEEAGGIVVYHGGEEGPGPLWSGNREVVDAMRALCDGLVL